MADKLDVGQLQATLHRVAAYREVCNAVRAGSGHTIFNGLLFLAVTYLVYELAGPHPFFYAYLAVALSEIGVGLWKRVRPSVECVLADGFVNGAFGLLVLGRQVCAWKGLVPGPVSPFSVLIGLWAMHDAYQSFKAYGTLRRAFVERPTADHMAYVDDLLREIRQSDPESDPTALDLPTRPRLRAKLLGDVAIFTDAPGGVFVADRGAVQLDRRPPEVAGDPAVGVLRLFGQAYPAFELPDASWENYRRWKGGS